MPTFRAYTPEEIESAARAYGVDPDFADLIYAKESSRGTNPKALEPRSVKRKRDSTIVRGPFQLEDGTTSDLIRKHKLGNVDIDDPDVHLDLAMRLMSDLQKRYNGDMSMMARAYLGFGTDELGTTDKKYARDIIADIEKLKAKKQKEERGGLPVIDVVPTGGLGAEPEPMPGMSDLNIASGEPDIFGYTPEPSARPMSRGLGAGGSWSDLVAAGRGQNAFALPGSMATGPGARLGDDFDVHEYLQSLVEDELGSRDFTNAG